MNIRITAAAGARLHLDWNAVEGAAAYRVRWSDRETAPENYKAIPADDTALEFPRLADRPYRFYVEALDASGCVLASSAEAVSDVLTIPQPQLETLNRGLVAVKTAQGVYLS